MRQFSNLEKQIIKALVSHPVGAEEGLIQVAAFLEDHYIGPKHGLSIMLQVSDNKVFVSLPEKERKAQQNKLLLTLTIFNLLNDLQQQGMIALIGEPQTENVVLGEQFQQGQTVALPEPIASFVIDVIVKYALVSEDLRNLAATNFEDPERIRHKQTMVVAIIALISSIILGLWGIFKDIVGC